MILLHTKTLLPGLNLASRPIAFFLASTGETLIIFSNLSSFLIVNQYSVSHGQYHGLLLLESAVFLAFSLMQPLSSSLLDS